MLFGPQTRPLTSIICPNTRHLRAQDPKTQAELLEYAKEGCTIFQVWRSCATGGSLYI